MRAGAPLQLADLAEGETAKEAAELDRLAAAFAGLRFEDVKPRRELAWPDAHRTAVATTLDGVEADGPARQDRRRALGDLRCPAGRSRRTGGARRCRDRQRGGGRRRRQVPRPSTSTQRRPRTARSAAEPAPLSAGEINERVQSWAYKVSTFTFDRLTPPRSEWLDDAGTS